MVEMEPTELKFIQMQPPEDEFECYLIKDGNTNAAKQKFNEDGEMSYVYPVNPLFNNTRTVPLCDVEIRIPNRIEEMFLAKEMKIRDKKEHILEGREGNKAKKEATKVFKEKKRKRSRSRKFKNKVLPIDSDTELELDARQQAGDSPRHLNDKGKKKNKKIKQKKRKQNKAKDEMVKGETAHIEVLTEEDVSVKHTHFPCVFGFIGQWLAKRRAKRRENEIKALDAAFASVSDLCCNEEYSRDGLNVDDIGIHVF